MILKKLLGRTRKAVNVVKDTKRFLFNSWDIGIFGWIFDEGKLLLAKTPSGNYTLPGGGLEREDTVDYREIDGCYPFREALKREVEEETQVKIESVDPSTELKLFRRGRFLSNEAVFVLVDNYVGKVKESGIEIKNASFYTKAEAKDKLEGRMKKAAMKAFEVYEEREDLN